MCVERAALEEKEVPPKSTHRCGVFKIKKEGVVVGFCKKCKMAHRETFVVQM